jgi:hypothetical protein
MTMKIESSSVCSCLLHAPLCIPFITDRWLIAVISRWLSISEEGTTVVLASLCKRCLHLSAASVCTTTEAPTSTDAARASLCSSSGSLWRTNCHHNLCFPLWVTVKDRTLSLS